MKYFVKVLIIFLVNMYYRLKYNFKGIGKDRIFIYTDSRGFLVNCLLCNKTPKSSYIDMLSNGYKIDYQLCPKKHTTILDFLDFVEKKDLSKYKYIILHLGIVDFSPRPLTQFDMVYNKKNNIVKRLFHDIEMKPEFYDIEYENEKTFSLYDTDFLQKIILPRLVEISKTTKIIWIGLNKVDVNWNGNYSKNRPSSINMILTYQKLIVDFLQNSAHAIEYLDIDEIQSFMLKVHTVDNMHLSRDGFILFYRNIASKLNE